MDQLTTALSAKDTDAFLKFFSRTKPWYAINTLSGFESRDRVTYAQLKRDFSSKTGLYALIFDGGAFDDVLRQYTMARGYENKPWEWHGDNTLSPWAVSEKIV